MTRTTASHAGTENLFRAENAESAERMCSRRSRAQSSSKLYVFLLDGNTLGVNRAKIGIVEETDEESFGGFL